MVKQFVLVMMEPETAREVGNAIHKCLPGLSARLIEAALHLAETPNDSLSLIVPGEYPMREAERELLLLAKDVRREVEREDAKA